MLSLAGTLEVRHNGGLLAGFVSAGNSGLLQKRYELTVALLLNRCSRNHVHIVARHSCTLLYALCPPA